MVPSSPGDFSSSARLHPIHRRVKQIQIRPWPERGKLGVPVARTIVSLQPGQWEPMFCISNESQPQRLWHWQAIHVTSILASRVNTAAKPGLAAACTFQKGGGNFARELSHPLGFPLANATTSHSPLVTRPWDSRPSSPSVLQEGLAPAPALGLAAHSMQPKPLAAMKQLPKRYSPSTSSVARLCTLALPVPVPGLGAIQGVDQLPGVALLPPHPRKGFPTLSHTPKKASAGGWGWLQSSCSRGQPAAACTQDLRHRTGVGAKLDGKGQCKGVQGTQTPHPAGQRQRCLGL